MGICVYRILSKREEKKQTQHKCLGSNNLNRRDSFFFLTEYLCSWT